MMLFLYRTGVRLYFILIRVVASFNPKAASFYSGRDQLFEDLKRNLPISDSPLVWFHAASLGEFEQGRPVMEALKRARPNVRILLTFFSPSGYNVRKGYKGADYICYLPVESTRNVKQFYDIANPKVAIFIKYEFWKDYIDEAKRRNILLLSISSTFRPNQLFFRSYGRFFLSSIKQFDHFFVQNDLSSDILKSAGIDQVTIAGDTRFDRVVEVKEQIRKLELAEEFKSNETVIVMGSVWPQDMEMLYPAIRLLGDKVRFIIAPHEIENAFLVDIERNSRVSSVRYSAAKLESVAQSRILLIDNIGMLSSLYGYGEVAFVGGGFRGGLHNTLEPAVFGIPVVWGDHRKNMKFNEVRGLTVSGGGIPIRNQDEAVQILSLLTEQGEKRREIGLNAGRFVLENTGATSKIMKYLNNKMSQL